MITHIQWFMICIHKKTITRYLGQWETHLVDSFANVSSNECIWEWNHEMITQSIRSFWWQHFVIYIRKTIPWHLRWIAILLNSRKQKRKARQYGNKANDDKATQYTPSTPACAGWGAPGTEKGNFQDRKNPKTSTRWNRNIYIFLISKYKNQKTWNNNSNQICGLCQKTSMICHFYSFW